MAMLAVDPGTTESAWVRLDDTGQPTAWGKQANDQVLTIVRGGGDDLLALEMVASYGMAVGAEVFQTCVWTGRFMQAWIDSDHRRGRRVIPVTRKQVVVHVCGSARGKDANVRQAMIDRFGPGKEKAIGKKATPGPLYGMRADEWQALALAVAVYDGAVPA